MRLSHIHENESSSTITPIISIVAEDQGMREALGNISCGEPSRTNGPVEVSLIDGKPHLINGYHRIVDKILSGEKTVSVFITSFKRPLRRRFMFTNSRLMGLESAFDVLDPDCQDNLKTIYSL